MQERKGIPQGKSPLNKSLEKKSWLVKKELFLHLREGVGTTWRHEAETHKSENKWQFILGSLSRSCAQAAVEKITLWSHVRIKACPRGKAVVPGPGGCEWELGNCAVGLQRRVRLHSHHNSLLSVAVLFQPTEPVLAVDLAMPGKYLPDPV